MTTLFQTTSRAPFDLGVGNLMAAGSAIFVRSPALSTPGSNATELGAVTREPYNTSVLAVGCLIVPSGFDITASGSESRPSPVVNITDARGFNVAASMLEASGVADDFEAEERGAGITIFVPTDDALAALPATDRLQSLPSDCKAVVLHSYHPLGSLSSS